MRIKPLLLAAAVALALPAAALAQDAAPMTAELVPGVTAKVISIKPVPGQKMLQLDYEITNNSGKPVMPGDLGLGDGQYGLKNIVLIDFASDKGFAVGLGNDCFCTPDTRQAIDNGQTLKAWAWFRPDGSYPGPFAVRFAKTYPILDVPVQ